DVNLVGLVQGVAFDNSVVGARLELDALAAGIVDRVIAKGNVMRPLVGRRRATGPDINAFSVAAATQLVGVVDGTAFDCDKARSGLDVDGFLTDVVDLEVSQGNVR